MKIFDTNLIIYSFNEEFHFLHDELFDTKGYVSSITKLEVLGYKDITADEKIYFGNLFSKIGNLTVSDDIIERGITLRQNHKMSLGDSIIAATALIHNLTLYTHNVRDFKWIKELKIVDPLKNSTKRK